MYVAEWITHEDGTLPKWIEQFTWKTENSNPEHPETVGKLIVWMNSDGGDEKKYYYANTKREVYEQLKDEAYNGYSLGSVFNRKVKGNPDIEEAERL